MKCFHVTSKQNRAGAACGSEQRTHWQVREWHLDKHNWRVKIWCGRRSTSLLGQRTSKNQSFFQYFLDFREEREESGTSVFLSFKIKVLTDSVLKSPPLFSGCTADAQATILDPSHFWIRCLARTLLPAWQGEGGHIFCRPSSKFFALYLYCCFFPFFLHSVCVFFSK